MGYGRLPLQTGSRLGTHEIIGLLGAGGMGEVYRAQSAKGDELILNVGPSLSGRIPFTTVPRVAFGQPQDFSRLGRAEGNPNIVRRNSDSISDGEHTIGVYTGGATGATEEAQIQVVFNWFEEVRQRAPRQQ